MKSGIFAVSVFAFILPVFAAAQTLNEAPARSFERDRIVDAIRPAAEKDLGSHLRFNIRKLNVSGGWAFVEADIRHADGHRIKWTSTPSFRREHNRTRSDIDNALSVLPECCQVQAILRRADNGHWSVVEENDTSTDVWWQSYCDKPAKVVVKEFCTGE